ncbi:MAG: D-glycero-beta-D-manno-heptose-7-phosphate kinase [Candidatus Sumerlaeaceae bacterium]|nr:D-glycero-beta-D-manno-heptose-7-phosphate kinase [Candidatus Sumerlaeaceae bacterium]
MNNSPIKRTQMRAGIVDWASILETMQKTRLLVVGDLILDHYVQGRTERTSPEAPVPVVVFEREYTVAGGAANVARNLRHFGASAGCIGIVGADAAGVELRKLLEAEGIDCSGILEVPSRCTTIKTRIISQNQQMLRLDRESTSPIGEDIAQRLLALYLSLLPHVHGVVISDYAKGLLTDSLLRAIIDAAKKQQVPVFVDPKGRDYSRYRGAFALTPNAREAAEASGVETRTDSEVVLAAEKITEITECEWVVVTRGARGVAIFRKDEEPRFVPTVAREVFDVTGAGDTFIAFLAMGVCAGLGVPTACQVANAAAGVVVGKVGAATVGAGELLKVLVPESANRKLLEESQLVELGERLRKSGKRIVFTNGCFDFLHAGHVALLQEAKRLGDVLVVAINSDDMITKLKGAPRPILKQSDRERLLSAIEAVDYIVVFDDETPHKLIASLRPDVLVKGRNYSHEHVEGHEIVESYGGQVILLDTLESISTRQLIDRHQKSTS